ncbi:MAG: DUF4364 family protein [Clostridia bacterium]|nr:DUF4364 family protein [Clostridia bacterium]
MARKKKQKVYWGNLEPGSLIRVEDIKILVCILLYTIKTPFTAETITHIIRYNSIATYFDIAQAISELERDKNITKDEEEKYHLTENGITIAKELCYDIPFTVRESVISAAEHEILLSKRKEENSIEIISDEDKFIVKVSMLENEKEIMGFTIRVNSIEEAERVKSNFLNDPNGFYVMNFRKLFGETQED